MKEEQSVTNLITKCKFQLILNKSLYVEEIIDKSSYEQVENRLLERISSLYESMGCNV